MWANEFYCPHCSDFFLGLLNSPWPEADNPCPVCSRNDAKLITEIKDWFKGVPVNDPNKVEH